jgi:hypothetical protein
VCRKEDRRIGSLQGPLEGQEKAALSRLHVHFLYVVWFALNPEFGWSQ